MKKIIGILAVLALLFTGIGTAQAKAGPTAKNVRTKHFSVSRTVSGVVWVVACDGRWDYGGTGGRELVMKSTTCNQTRNGVSSNVKMDAARWYADTGVEFGMDPEYFFGGSASTTDDITVGDLNHVEDRYMGGNFPASTVIKMKLWGLPNAGDAVLTDTATV